MSQTLTKGPSRGRLFKLFTEIGPYFRHLQSDEKTFFFDCLEICVDAKKDPENRTFLGWWVVVNRQENQFTYQRYNGLYNLQGEWEEAKITKKQMLQLDQAFQVFIEKLSELIDVETGFELTPE